MLKVDYEKNCINGNVVDNQTVIMNDHLTGVLN